MGWVGSLGMGRRGANAGKLMGQRLMLVCTPSDCMYTETDFVVCVHNAFLVFLILNNDTNDTDSHINMSVISS